MKNMLLVFLLLFFTGQTGHGVTTHDPMHEKLHNEILTSYGVLHQRQILEIQAIKKELTLIRNEQMRDKSIFAPINKAINWGWRNGRQLTVLVGSLAAIGALSAGIEHLIKMMFLKSPTSNGEIVPGEQPSVKMNLTTLMEDVKNRSILGGSIGGAFWFLCKAFGAIYTVVKNQ
jgi:hypothetical protein